MDIRALVGRRVKELRQERKISQEKLALLANLDRTYITSVETGKRNISMINLQKICRALHCDLAQFFESDPFRSTKDE